MRSAIILTALIFLGIGVALGTWILPEGEGESGFCINVRAELERGEASGDYLLQLADYYDNHCR